MAETTGLSGQRLTDREREVLYGMAAGKSNAEIGRDLFLTEDTVKTHARRLFRKLGARDRAHAVANGFRTGVLTHAAEPPPQRLPRPQCPLAAPIPDRRVLAALARHHALREHLPARHPFSRLYDEIRSLFPPVEVTHG